MTVASAFLAKLFKRAERARLRSACPSRLPLTQAQCPAYFAMRNLAEADAFRGELQAAANAGAIAIETAPGHRWPRDVAAIAVVDMEQLAAYLGVTLLKDRVDAARRLLGPLADRHPSVTDILADWAAGRTVGGAGPDHAEAVREAVAVVDARLAAREDALIRRESIRLFGDSKRIEARVAWIRRIALSEDEGRGLTNEEVLATLGLFREPQPFLIAGVGSVQVDATQVPLVRPYLGLPVEALRGFSIAGTRFLLTIENKQTFHECARLPDAAFGIVLYTGGMPSPAWSRAYRSLVDALPQTAALLHFGDLDLGGFRIANAVQAAAGRPLRPWQMDPDAYHRHGIALNIVSAGRALEIERAARDVGWNDVADEISRCPGSGEQEALPAVVPTRR